MVTIKWPTKFPTHTYINMRNSEPIEIKCILILGYLSTGYWVGGTPKYHAWVKRGQEKEERQDAMRAAICR